MNIRETIEDLVTKMEAAFSEREQTLANREQAIATRESHSSNTESELTKKEKALTEWEATLRTRETGFQEEQAAFDEEAAAFDSRSETFEKWRTAEITALDNRQRKLTADEKGLVSAKELLEMERKQIDILKQKLVSDRADLDRAWTQFKYEKLKT